MPLSVARRIDHTVPITVTNSIAPSVWPNQSSASGTQQTLGSVCMPRASTPIVSEQMRNREFRNPRGSPTPRPIA